MAQSNDLTFVFTFKSRATGNIEIKKLKTTYDNLAKGINNATLASEGFTKSQIKASRNILKIKQAEASAGLDITGGVLGADVGRKSTRGAAAAAKSKRTAGFKKYMGGIYATMGFGGMQVAHQLSRSLDSVNFTGILAPTIEKIGTGIGSLFGSVLGSVLGDVSRAIGTAIETILQHYLIIIRTILKAVSGLISGIFLSLIGASITGPIGIALGLVTGFLNAIVAIATGAVELIMNIIKGVFAIIGSLITAALTVVKSIFDAGFNAISAAWNGFWEGMKGIAEAFWEGIKALTQEGLNQLKQGFMDLIESERLAAKAYIQITDVQTNKTKTFMQGVYDLRDQFNKLRVSFGINEATTATAGYKVLSGGFRDTADAMKVLNAAGQLNLIGQGDMISTTDALRTVMQAYGNQASEATTVAAQMNAIVKLGAFELNEFAARMGNVVNMAANVKMSLTEVGTVISFASKKGLNTARSTIGLSRAIEALISPGNKARKVLAGIGYDADKFAKTGRISLKDLLTVAERLPMIKLKDVFPTKQSRNLMVTLMNDVEGVRKEFQVVRDIEKEFDNDVKKMKETWSYLKDTMVEIGKVIREDIIVPFSKVLGPIFASLGETVRTIFGGIDFKTVFTGLATSLKPIFEEIGGFVKYIVEEFGTFLKGGGFNKIFSSDVFKQIVFYATRLFKIFVNLPEVLAKIFPIFDKFGGIGKFLVWCFDQITDPANWTSVIITFEKMVAGATFVYEVLRDTFNTELFSEVVAGLFNSLGMTISALGKFLIDVFNGAFAIVIDFFMANFGVKLKKIALDFIGTLLIGIGKVLASLSGIIREVIAPLPQELPKPETTKGGGIVGAIGALGAQGVMPGMIGGGGGGGGGGGDFIKKSFIGAKKFLENLIPSAFGNIFGKVIKETANIANEKTGIMFGDVFAAISKTLIEEGTTFKNQAKGIDITKEEIIAREKLAQDLKNFGPIWRVALEKLGIRVNEAGAYFKGNLIRAFPSEPFEKYTNKMNELNSPNYRMGMEGILGKSYIRPGGMMGGGWDKKEEDKKSSNKEKKIIKYFAMPGFEQRVLDMINSKYPGAMIFEQPTITIGGKGGMGYTVMLPETITDPLKQTADTTKEQESPTQTSLKDIAKNTGELVEIFRPLKYKGNVKNASGALRRGSKMNAGWMAGDDEEFDVNE